MTDPFTPIELPHPRSEGDLDVAGAVRGALAAVGRNAHWYVPGLVIAVVGYLLAVVTLVGWVVLVPLGSWALYRAVLAAVDGRVSDVRLLEAGFRRIFVRGWGLVLVLLLFSLPLYALLVPFVFLPVLTPLSWVPHVLWGFAVCRLGFAPWLVVDRGVPVLDAYSASWRVTAGPWRGVFGLQLVLTLVALPADALNACLPQESVPLHTLADGGVEAWVAVTGLDDGRHVALMLFFHAVALLGLFVYAAAYRQLFPRG